MSAITVCNHDVINPSKTLGKLLTRCEECKRCKKWPWAKMLKCCRTYNNTIYHIEEHTRSTPVVQLYTYFSTECKKLWHTKCLSPRIRSSLAVETDARSEPQPKMHRDFVKAVYILPEKRIRNELHRKNRNSICADFVKSVRIEYAKGDKDSDEITILPGKEESYKRNENFLVSEKETQTESHSSALGSFRADVAKSLRVDHGLRGGDSNISNQHTKTLLPILGSDQVLQRRELPSKKVYT